MNKKKLLKYLFIVFASTVVLFAAGCGFIYYCNHVIAGCGNRCYNDLKKIPARDIGLLLGVAKVAPSGSPNAYFRGRVEAAAELYHAGKIRHIIISGDNSRKDYNEPRDMKEALLEKNVPADAMTLDYAGFRTLDSVVRAKQIFDCSRITVISQRYHAERAVYIAARNDIDAIAFAAADPPWKWLQKRNLRREKYARVAAWLDVNILHRNPRFGGDKIKLMLPSNAQTDGKITQ